MQISGLQRLTLIDYPKKIACTIFLFGCNFKCGFCHNPELVLPDKEKFALSEEEVLSFLQERKKYLDGVCITGGEPLLYNEIDSFLQKIKALGYDVKIDTNGTNPDLLKKLIDRKLVDFVAMDIKSDRNNYDIVACTSVDMGKIEESIRIITNSNIDYEFRTTVVPKMHNVGNIDNIGSWLQQIAMQKPKKYVIQNFVPRRGKMIDDKFEMIEGFSSEELEKIKDAVSEYFEEVEIRN